MPKARRPLFRPRAKLAGAHTVIMISHRLSALEHADEIYVLEQGKLAQHGTHAQLLAQGGAYAKLWEKQSQLEAFAHGVAQESIEEFDAREADSQLQPAQQFPSCGR